MQKVVKPGLYRHFKGEYFFVQNVARDETRKGIWMCYYFNVCHPEYGVFVRPVDDWYSTTTDNGEIAERPDNVTGQTYRFERVEDLNFQISSISTDQLIRELSKRYDSPIRDLDIKGAEALVFSRDYVVGRPIIDSEYGNHLSFWNAFSTRDEAVNYVKETPGCNLFKRILLIENI